MHPDLQRYLDGELPREALSPELAREAAEWEPVLRDAAALGGETAPPWLESRIMASLPERPLESAPRRALLWLLEPHSVRLRPATALAAICVAIAALALWRGSEVGARLPAPQNVAQAPAAPEGASVVYVQFSLSAPGAQSVQVAGDFNDWAPEHAPLRDPEGDGTWTGVIPLLPGIHKYMFVVDGRRWVSDPQAHRSIDDGFGMKNSLIAIAPPTRSS